MLDRDQLTRPRAPSVVSVRSTGSTYLQQIKSGVRRLVYAQASTAVKYLCLRISWCPVFFVSVSLVIVSGMIVLGLSLQPVKIDASFDSFMKTDIESSVRLDVFYESMRTISSSRRLQTTAVVKEVHLIHELREGLQDGLFNMRAQMAMAKFEQGMRNLPGWQELCQFASSRERQMCNPGVSFANYMLPSQDLNGWVPESLTLNGEGHSLLPLWTAWYLASRENTLDILMPKEPPWTSVGSAGPQTHIGLLRSSFRFRMVATAQHSTSALKDRWRNFCEDELLPYFRRSSLTGPIRVYWDGADLEELEVYYELRGDLMFSIGSVAFVLTYLHFHTLSPLLSIMGLLVACLAVPSAYILSAWIAGSTSISFASFLSVFIIIGFGSDVVFAYTDCWVDSKDLFRRDADRLAWTMTHAGKASFVTTVITSLSFFANLASVIRALRQLGFFMGLCVLFSWILLSIIYLPLCLIDERCFGCRERCTSGSGFRHRCFKEWARHVHRWRLLYMVIPSVSLFIMLIIAVVKLDLDVDGVDLFPDNHNQCKGQVLMGEFKPFADAVDSSLSSRSTTVRVCTDLALVIRPNISATCGLYWCDAQPSPASNVSITCFRRPRPCSAPKEIGLRMFHMNSFSNQDEMDFSNYALAAANSLDYITVPASIPTTVSTSPAPLVLQDWAGGTGFRAVQFDLTRRLVHSTNSNPIWNCGFDEVCFQGSQLCNVDTSLWQPMPQWSLSSVGSVRRLDAQTLPPVRFLQATVPRANRGYVYVIFGMGVDTGVPFLGTKKIEDRWSFQTSFDASHVWAQRNAQQFCETFPASMKVDRKWCWITAFRDYVLAQGKPFPAPVSEFHTLAIQFNQAANNWKKKAWVEGGEVKAYYFSFRLMIHKTAADTSEVLDVKSAWDAYVNNWNQEANIFARGAWHVSSMWVDAERKGVLISSTLMTLLTLLVLAFLGMLCFTRSCTLSALVVVSVMQVICGLMFFIIVVMGWKLGLIEVVALLYFMGYALTYSLHIAHKFGTVMPEDDLPSVGCSEGADECSQLRLARTSWALRCMGGVTIGSATTTAGSAAFLLFCTLTIFLKLGTMCLIVTLMSIFVALVPLPAALLVLGPARPTGMCCSCCRRRAWRDGTGCSGLCRPQLLGSSDEEPRVEEPIQRDRFGACKSCCCRRAPKTSDDGEDEQSYEARPSYEQAIDVAPVPVMVSSEHTAPANEHGRDIVPIPVMASSEHIAPPHENGRDIVPVPVMASSEHIAPPHENGIDIAPIPVMASSEHIEPPKENGNTALAAPGAELNRQNSPETLAREPARGNAGVVLPAAELNSQLSPQTLVWLAAQGKNAENHPKQVVMM